VQFPHGFDEEHSLTSPASVPPADRYAWRTGSASYRARGTLTPEIGEWHINEVLSVQLVKRWRNDRRLEVMQWRTSYKRDEQRILHVKK
jgi:hypothetical protein